MINGRFNFILKVIFWITRQPINQVIDNPDSPPQRQGGGPKGPSLFSKDDETCFLREGKPDHGSVSLPTSGSMFE